MTTADLLLNAFVTLIVVVDPVSLVPIFGALTQKETDAERRRIAFRGVAIAAAVLVIFTFIGNPLLSVLGISLSAFRVAGGVLLFLLAIDMVLVRDSGLRSTTVREQAEAAQRQDISVFPLAIPLIGGPGAITTMLLLNGRSADIWVTLALLGVLMLVLGLALLSLLLTGRLMKLIGVTGSGVVSRVLGVLLAALAVQFIVDGLNMSFGQSP